MLEWSRKLVLGMSEARVISVIWVGNPGLVEAQLLHPTLFAYVPHFSDQRLLHYNSRSYPDLIWFLLFA